MSCERSEAEMVAGREERPRIELYGRRRGCIHDLKVIYLMGSQHENGA